MSRSEKLQMMEALWEDLSRDESTFESPAWHGEALRETEQRMAAGLEQTMDWDKAKELLRQKCK